MAQQHSPKPKRPAKLVLIIAGSLLALCMVCGLVSTLSRKPTPSVEGETTVVPSRLDAATATPSPSATIKPTIAPTKQPSPTPDYTAEARQFQADVIALFTSAENKGKRFAKQAQAIADGASYDMTELYLRGKAAAEAWEAVKFAIHRLKPQSPDLQTALSELSLCASYREDAYRAALKWIDSQKASDMAAYKEKMDTADQLMLSAFARIVTIAGIEPTAQP